MKQISFARLAVALALAATPCATSLPRAQVRVAASDAAPVPAAASVEALAQFLRERAGVELGESVKSRLAEMEGRARSGAGPRLRARELADILADTALQRLSTLTDEEIERAAGAYRADRSYSGLSWGEVEATPQEFARELRRLRERSRGRGAEPLYEELRAVAAGRASEGGVERHLKLYARLLPEQFGSALREGVTPLQAVLIVYAMASDDPIHWPLSRLHAEMEHAHRWRGGAEFPDPAGRVAYGPEGYLFPTPLDLLFNDRTMNALLDKLEGRHKK